MKQGFEAIAAILAARRKYFSARLPTAESKARELGRDFEHAFRTGNLPMFVAVQQDYASAWADAMLTRAMSLMATDEMIYALGVKALRMVEECGDGPNAEACRAVREFMVDRGREQAARAGEIGAVVSGNGNGHGASAGDVLEVRPDGDLQS